MNVNSLKITYNMGIKKLNTYLKMPSPNFHVLKKEVELCLFDQRQQPRCEIRAYWIDEDGDEIELINQNDYDIFMSRSSNRQHLQIAPVDVTVENPTVPTSSSSEKPNTPPPNDSYDFAVHDHVECDSCLMSPIIGFRYKCIQCPNYDLCQNCELKHIHSEHMMVRMPTNNCPSVVEAYVSGRTSGRRHGKRSKPCAFVNNGISVVIDDDAEAQNSAGSANGEQPSPENSRERRHSRRHHRRHNRNFFSNLYEMMNDLAEGGGSVAAGHATGEASTSSKASTSGNGSETNTKSSFKSNVEDPIKEAAAAATIAHETAAKAAELAAKVAHETALKATKNIIENMTGSDCSFAAPRHATATGCEEKQKEPAKEKVDATTSPCDPEPRPTRMVFPSSSSSLDGLAQFLDPQYMKTGIQILNNFSDMFAKMLDPMENMDGGHKEATSNLRKNSATSSKSSVGSNFNSFDSGKKSDEEKSSPEINQEKTPGKQACSSNSSHVEIVDLGSDSENESAAESFVKISVPKEENSATPSPNKSSTTASAQTTPPQTLDKSSVIDFAQLSADLKAHIANETTKNSMKSVETATDCVDMWTAGTKPVVTTSTPTTDGVDKATRANEPVVNTTSTSTSTTSNKNEERRAVPVYHSNQSINQSVHAMMSMGFSNEGGCLTRLLESVNGNIEQALDLMAAAQRDVSQ